MILLIILLIIGAIVFAFGASIFIAPILIINNRKRLKEMRAIQSEFHEAREGRSKRGELEHARVDAINKLTAIKRRIWVGDKKALEDARDILNSIV